MPKRSKQRTRGRGVLDTLFKGPRQHAPPAVRNFIEKHADSNIIDIWVGRTPLSNPIASAVNTISGGEFERQRRQQGMNDIYHSYVIITLDTGQSYRLEKNHVVEITPYHDNNDKKLAVKLTEPISVPSFIFDAEDYQATDRPQRPNFWNYDPVNNNCQYFVDDLMQGSRQHIYNREDVNKFSFQPNASSTVSEVRPLLTAVTDVASTLDRVLFGDGFKDTRYRR